MNPDDLNPDESNPERANFEEPAARGLPPEDQDRLWTDPTDREEGQDEVAALQDILSPFRSEWSRTDRTDFGALLAQTALRAEQGRRRTRTIRRTALLAAVVLIGVFVLNRPDDAATDEADRTPGMLEVGTVVEGPRRFEVGGVVTDLRTGGRVRIERSGPGRTELVLMAGEAQVVAERPFVLRTDGFRLRTEQGRFLVSEPRGGDLEIQILDGEATLSTEDQRLGTFETFLPASARITLLSSGKGEPPVVGTPWLGGTSPQLVGICEKLDRGRPDRKTERFLIESVAKRAVSATDTFVLWSLLARADSADEPRARRILERRLGEIAGYPAAGTDLKLPSFSTAEWRKHLASGW